MLKITPSISISRNELSFQFIRASGPGGQNVNKVATAAVLHFDVNNSPSLSEEVKSRLVKLAGKKVTRNGILIIEAKRYRLQERNRADAEKRLVALIQKALMRPQERLSTEPTYSSQQERVAIKKKRSAIKRQRQMIRNDD
jgi:ribosome-associated protein